MDKMDVTIGISADASGVEAGVQRSKRSLAELGKSAKGVSDNLSGMGDGAAVSAKKIERDTRSMQTSIQRQIAVMQAGSKSSREYWESLAGQRGVNPNALKPYLDQLDQARKKTDDAKQATIGFGDAMRVVQAAAAGGVLLSVASQYMQLADAATNVVSRLKLVTGSTQELASAQAGLFAIAQKARVSYTDLADTYAQMARSTKELGVSQRDMLGITETISKAVTISGASAASAQAALIQLSQGFASGTLRGEELNSVMEQTPRLAMAIANGMGVSIGKLRELGQAGELTADKVVQALQNSAGDVAREFDQMATTVEQATTKAGNSLVRLIGIIDQTTGASGVAADGISRFARGLDTFADSIQGMAASNSLSDFFTSAFQSNENLNAELKISEAEMAKLAARLAKAPDNIYVRSQIADLQKYIAGLKEAQARLAALTGAPVAAGVSDPRDQSQYTGRGQSYANYAKQQEAARQALLEISAKSNGVSKQFTGDLKAYEEALRTGVISTNDYVKAVTELNQKRYESTEAGKAEAKAAKDAAKGNKEGESAILSYIKSLEARTAAQRLEIAQGDKLTESQRARIQLEALLADSKSKASKSQIAYAQGLLTEAEANEAWLKNASDVEKALSDMQKARDQSLRSVQDSVKKLVEEAEATAYAEQQNISLAEAVERLALARAENAYQQALERQESPATLAALEAELQARKKIVELTAQKGVKEANKKAQEQIAKDWERTAQTIGDTLADYIMGGGKDAAQYLKRLFATLVLQPVVQTVVGSVMGTGSAAVAGGAANPLGLLQSGQSLWSAFSGGLTGTLGGSVASLGAMMGSSAATAFGSGIVAGGNLGLFGGGIGQGLSMIGSGAAGSTAAGLGTIAGAALPWVAGAAALYSLVKSFDNSGTPHMGAGAIYSGGSVSDGRGIYNRGTFGMGAAGEWSSSNQAAISGIAGTLGASLDGFAKAFGKEAGYTVATAFADDSSGDGAWGSLRIKDALGNVLVDWERSRSSKWAPRIFADGEAGYQQYLSAVAADVKNAFLAMDLPEWADEMLSAAVSIDTLSAAIQQIGAVKSVFDSLGTSLAMFRDLSGAVQTKLLQVSGGIDALAANAQSFYANYYSEQEKLDAVVGGLTTTMAKYGVQLPTTAEAYRALVEKQMAAGESAAELAAVLLSLNGTFKQVADAWKQELQGMGDAVTGIFDGLYTSIGQLKDATAADRASILRGDQAMSADAIAAAIQAASIAAPSVSGLTAAAAGISAAQGSYAQTEVAYKGALSVSDAKKQSLDETTARRDALQQQLDRATASHNATFANFTRIWDGRLGSYAGRMRHRAEWAVMEVEYANLSKSLGQEIESLNAVIAGQTVVYDEAASATELYAKRLEEAKKAIESAQQAELQAKVEYASEMAQFIQDAGTSVTKLSDLRGEVMSFYEAQAQAVQAMLASAGNIRAVVDAVRLSQLSAAQTAQELGARYAMDYSMALATTGTARAGYVDSMAGNLGALSEALRSESVTSTDWRVQTAKLLAQANKAADLLEGDAQGDNYQDVALGLLDGIDAKLEALSGVATAGENLIVQAIKEGTVNTLDGLRAVVAALKGDPVPAFAAGGLHAGGLRLVGERGPELEVTGPARYWSTSQTAAMLGGGSTNMQRVERLLEQRNEEARAQASAIVRLQQDVNRLLMRWETQGMPEQREVSAI